MLPICINKTNNKTKLVFFNKVRKLFNIYLKFLQK